MDLHTLNDAHGYTEPVADPKDIADEDPSTAYERASAAASEPPAHEAIPETEPEQPKLTPEALIAALEWVQGLGVEAAARRYHLPMTDELRELGELHPIERQIATATAPHVLANLDQLEAFLQKYGHVVFGATVFLGVLMRTRYVKAMAAEREREHAEKNAAEARANFHAAP